MSDPSETGGSSPRHPRPDVALVTSADLPDLTADDLLLADALRERGVVAQPAVWDDPAVDWARAPVTVIRSPWDYVDRREAFVAWAERTGAVTSLENPAAVVRRNTHKGYLRDLAAAGLPVVDTVWLGARTSHVGGGETGPVDLGDVLREAGFAEAVVKPCVSASARGTVRLRAAEAAAHQGHLDALLAVGDVMVQPFMASVAEEGELSVVVIDGTPSHAVRKRPAAGDFRVQPRLGGTEEPLPLDDELRAAAAAVVAADGLGPLLYRRVDLVRDDAGVLRLVELELVEPSLYLAADAAAPARLADAVVSRLEDAA